jgi:hypothetical protein
MRFIIEATLPVEVGNEAIRDGSLLQKVNEYIGTVKPEAVYFGVANGQRTMFVIVDLPSSEKLVSVTEPLWLLLEADVTYIPVMNADDFAKARPDLERLGRS